MNGNVAKEHETVKEVISLLNFHAIGAAGKSSFNIEISSLMGDQEVGIMSTKGLQGKASYGFCIVNDLHAHSALNMCLLLQPDPQGFILFLVFIIQTEQAAKNQTYLNVHLVYLRNRKRTINKFLLRLQEFYVSINDK